MVSLYSISLSLSKTTTMKPHSRKLLQDEDATRTTLSPSVTYSPDPLVQPMNGTSSTLNKRPFRTNSPFDSSMALTALVLLTALFFMGFFSIYIRRFADDSADVSRRRRRHNPRSIYSSSSLPPRRSNFRKDLDDSTVRSLQVVSYCGDAKNPIDCAICLSEFEERETVKVIPYCHHVFHAECIETWLSSHVSCPLCRSSQMFVVEEDDCLGVSQGEVDNGDGEDHVGSTAESGGTWVEEGREVGPVELRRTCSCPSLGDQVVLLQRSLSF